jgi:O-antigen chain-terminating methyltransferase
VDGTADYVAREFPMLRLQPAFQPSDENAGYHVDDLLQYHDKDFLRNAYQAILKRFPDAEGFNRYLQRLRSGRINKLDVLASLRYSAEGMAHSVKIKSLRLPALVRRASRIPVAGYVVQLLIAIARLPRNIEMQRQTAAHSIAQDERIAEHINELARHITAEQQHFATQLTLSRESIRRLEDRHRHLESSTAKPQREEQPARSSTPPRRARTANST